MADTDKIGAVPQEEEEWNCGQWHEPLGSFFFTSEANNRGKF